MPCSNLSVIVFNIFHVCLFLQVSLKPPDLFLQILDGWPLSIWFWLILISEYRYKDFNNTTLFLSVP